MSSTVKASLNGTGALHGNGALNGHDAQNGHGALNGRVQSHSSDTLHAMAGSLIQRALDSFDEKYGFSSASCQVYDTAWVAMITKTTEGKKQWLFPESFHFLLRNQAHDGSWGFDITSQTVGILDTAAALLALLKHAAQPLQVQDYSTDELAARIHMASHSLGAQLATWTDILSTNHIGVELIMPALLKYLQDEDASLGLFDFNSKNTLEYMSAAKLARFRPEMLYEQRPSSAIHSLEAFVGKIDFDKVSHHLFNGSMMASPSSTAAYLINASTWNDEAEGYLQHIVKAGAGHGDGGIAGTFPIHYFEFNWVAVTLLQAGFDIFDSNRIATNGIVSIVKRGFALDRGVIGFDDTAKGLLALKRLGQHSGVSPDVMIKIFEREDAFTTFGDERDRSLSSNCHVLLALLEWNDGHQYASQIRKTATFHLSHLYPTMLMVEAFTALVRNYESNSASQFLSEELVLKVCIALFQACTRTLLEQREDGSWEGSAEQTAYAVLALAEARSLCFLQDFQYQLKRSVEKGAAFLVTGAARTPERYWTSKTSYSVKLVFEAYKLAALKVSTALDQPHDLGRTLGLGDHISKMSRYIPLLQRTPLFLSMPEWQIWASLVESALFIPLLESRRLDIFPRDTFNKTRDNYLEIIPFTWIGCNNRSKTFAPTNFMFDLMVISLITYQIDEFMESVAGPAFLQDPNGLHILIDSVTSEAAQTKGSPASDVQGSSTAPPNVYKPLTRLANHVLGHERVRGASVEDSKWMEEEFKNFLHAHARQGENNVQYSQQLQGAKGQVYDARRPYFQWVRTMAADHVAVTFSLAWSSCWLSANLGDGVDVFASPTEKYFVTAAERHLSSACRMCNDFSSVARDISESNVNSLFFPEFDKLSSGGLPAQKRALASLAEYEQSCLKRALDSLGKAVADTTSDNSTGSFNQRKLDIIGYFCEVGQLYNQLYMLRDLSASNARPSS